MVDSIKYNWGKFIRVDDNWINKFLQTHKEIQDTKLVVRCYSVKFSGTLQNYSGLIDHFTDNLDKFVFCDAEIEEMRKKKKNPYPQALKYFGKVDPEKEGKYGELILFLFVESVLKAPMIAHKIQITYSKDQVKGSDGLFVGEYGGFSALFIGESKMMKTSSTAITDALKSVDRFHGHKSADKNLQQDLLIAKKTISQDLSEKELAFVYNSLDTSCEEFCNNIIVHPILIIYDDKNIGKYEEKAIDNEQAETLIKKQVENALPDLVKQIKNKLDEKFPELKKVYLDFFFIPIKDVSSFRHNLFESIHGVEYVPQEKK